jgi:hypothetical protein
MKSIIEMQYLAMKAADLKKAISHKSKIISEAEREDWRKLPDCDTRIMFEIASKRGII